MNTKMRNLFASLLCMVMLLGLFSTPALAVTVIEEADIMVSHPVHLANPETFPLVVGNCQIDTSCNSNNYNNGLRWRDIANSKYMSEEDTFVGGKLYELSVVLVPKTGYFFANTETKVTVNMDPATLSVQSDGSKATATITLIADNLYINYVNITGLDTPKVGEPADFSANVQEETCNTYQGDENFAHNGVAWYDSTMNKYLIPGDKFEFDHAYCVNIFVEAKPGYEFPQNCQALINEKSCTSSPYKKTLLQMTVEYPALADSKYAEDYTVQLDKTSYTYNGKERKPFVTVQTSFGDYVSATNYTVTYEENPTNVGTYQVIVEMKGNYTGTNTLSYTINPVKTKVSKLSAGKKKITVTIAKKTTQVTGYQIQYSTSKKFKKAKIKTISKYKTTKYTLKKLRGKKKYYVRVRTYKTVEGVKFYSDWSAAKSAKTKK